MLSPILALFAHISKPLWLNIRSTGAEVAGGQKTFLPMDASNEDRVSTVSSPKTKTETETETGGFQDQDRDQDSEVPRPRLVKTGLETSRDQDSSLENSKSDYKWPVPAAINFLIAWTATVDTSSHPGTATCGNILPCLLVAVEQWPKRQGIKAAFWNVRS